MTVSHIAVDLGMVLLMLAGLAAGFDAVMGREARQRPPAIPPHTDPPLPPAEAARVAERWPHLVSSYYREDHTP